MNSERQDETDRPNGRAQLTIDFLIGIATFLLVVGLVFSFVPEMLVPFTNSQSSHPTVADRTATHLAEDRLAAEPGVLDGDATEAFFEGSDDGADLGSELGIDEPVRVAVALDGPDDALERGPSPPRDDGQTTVAHRTMTDAEENHRLVVEVW